MTTTRPGSPGVKRHTVLVESQLGKAEPETLPELFLRTTRQFAARPAILRKQKGKYTPITYREFYDQAMAIAAGFLAIGVGPRDRVAFISENRPEWVFCDMACQLLGLANVPIYPTLPANQVEYILKDSGCRVVIVSDALQLAKVSERWGALPELDQAIIMDPDARVGANTERVQSLEAVVRRGQAVPDAEATVLERARQVLPEQVASIVYTSGTTGDPKGAMLTQRNFTSNANSISQVVTLSPEDVFLSFLPLNHCFERLAGYYFPVLNGACVAYAESALRVKQNLPEVQPTVLIGAPRLYDGMREGVLQNLSKLPAKQQKLIALAMRIGALRARRLEARQALELPLLLLWTIVDRLALARIREKIGCGRMRYLVSGSAPLPRATAEFLLSLGIGVLEGWGLTETSPVLSVNCPDWFKVGTVGRAIPGVEVRAAADGELISRGPNTMLGYLHKPDATAEVIDAEGWFHTGDIGEIDIDGFIAITDRKKDLLALATGKKVAPQPIENRLKASPYIREAVVLGDGMSNCFALIIPSAEIVQQKAAEEGWAVADAGEMFRNPAARKLIRSEIDRLSEGLADYEKIRQFALLNATFSIESGELTPTLKVKRKIIAEKYRDVIDSLRS